MAAKTGRAGQKITIRIAARKPRNPFALRARQRAGGLHGKSSSGLRGQAKRGLRKLLIED